LIGIILQVVQLFTSIRDRESLRDLTGDPWDGRSLEWSTPSPPPAFNFPVLPDVHGEEAYWSIKEAGRDQQHPVEEPRYEAIEIPRNSPTGVVSAFFATAVGFALIWHIWWMAIFGLIGAYATFVVFAWRDSSEVMVPAAEIARLAIEARRSVSGAVSAQP
jgi:cytochrome o ubiquinol oxidase subunit 1